MSKNAKFGPGGNCEWFKAEGNKNSAQMPAFLNKIGLTAYEVECGRGVRMNDAVAWDEPRNRILTDGIGNGSNGCRTSYGFSHRLISSHFTGIN